MTILSTLAALTAVTGAFAMALTLRLPVADPGPRSGSLRGHPAVFRPGPVPAARVLSPGAQR